MTGVVDPCPSCGRQLVRYGAPLVPVGSESRSGAVVQVYGICRWCKLGVDERAYWAEETKREARA